MAKKPKKPKKLRALTTQDQAALQRGVPLSAGLQNHPDKRGFFSERFHWAADAWGHTNTWRNHRVGWSNATRAVLTAPFRSKTMKLGMGLAGAMTAAFFAGPFGWLAIGAAAIGGFVGGNNVIPFVGVRAGNRAGGLLGGTIGWGLGFVRKLARTLGSFITAKPAHQTARVDLINADHKAFFTNSFNKEKDHIKYQQQMQHNKDMVANAQQEQHVVMKAFHASRRKRNIEAAQQKAERKAGAQPQVVGNPAEQGIQHVDAARGQPQPDAAMAGLAEQIRLHAQAAQGRADATDARLQGLVDGLGAPDEGDRREAFRRRAAAFRAAQRRPAGPPV